MTKLKPEKDVVLAPLTTLKVGGPARFFVRCETEEEAAAAVEFSESEGIPLLVLGGGSNMLVSDAGFDGLVMQVAIKGILAEDGSGGETRVLTVGAGEDWDGFVSYCVERDLAGIECLSGIPGLTGAAPVQNIGAYGQEVSETIVSVRCFDRKTRSFVTLGNDECGFAYRKSIFNSDQAGRYIIVSVRFRLAVNGRPKIAYGDLRSHFGGREPELREMREAVIAIRRAKSMVIDPEDPNSLSAGSFFKNPIVPKVKYEAIAASFDGQEVPHFNAEGGLVKIPAAWLIERAGFHKGYRFKNASISSRHTLAIINSGGATAAEIVGLKDLIVRGVKDRFGVELLPEPTFVGFS
ncbi:MAG: UDP-N-acetylmuramate dehydrogenase [Chloracidobacterium sp.]|nr:UDP-N-acetylmuramate dehydrogenase [Chloracidobacterium sp.]